MRCSHCGNNNPDTNQFCRECGTNLSQCCSKCGADIMADDKFCGQCGYRLPRSIEPFIKNLSLEEKLNKLQRYLPKGITEKVLSQRDKIEGELKQVTVMFCDMVGFTSIVEEIGADEAYTIMDQIYEILIHKVHDYEGTVNEMTGDGIMALFGAPVALEDAPQRAIRAAMAIHREMSKFSDRIKQEDIPTIKMRIGIHTGLVVVGSLGNDLRVEFKVVGDTVNLASRIEGLAEPGATYISEDTLKLSEGLFRVEALGARKIKGKKDSVKIYRVITTSSRKTRFDVSAETGLTPFVGRKRELELLLDGFERAKAGRGQAFSIMSEAGVGKSRLLYEFRKAVSNENVTFLEGKCLSYSRGVPYHPILDILKANFNIQESDDDLGITEKVKNGLENLGADEASTLPYLLELFSVKDSGIDKIPMSPEARKDRTMSAISQIPIRGSEIRPLVIAIEDLHWIDKNSEEQLKRLFMSISGARIFLIFTYRTEYVHTWGARSYHSQVTLNRLSNRESLAMVSHLLKTDEIDSDIEKLVLEKTEGVPFFIEEFIKALMDLKIIEETGKRYHLVKDVRDFSIPSTIQDVIMARVDSLPDEVKDLLQAGSVIERVFSYGLIKKVTGLPEQELLSHLSALKDSELIYERGIYPESTYIFKHALTREVVYDSILTRKKKRLHEYAGTAIEELNKENIDEHYEALARHFIYGKNYEKGARYSRFSERKSEKAVLIKEAVIYAKKRIDCLEKLPETEEMQIKIIDARTTLSLYYCQLADTVSAKEAIDPIVDLALEKNNRKMISRIYFILGKYNSCVKENISEAIDYLEKAINIAEEEKVFIVLLLASHELGITLSNNCEFERGLTHFRKALEINVAANSRWGISIAKSILAIWVYYFQGKMNLAFQTSSDALKIAEESGDTLSKSYAYLFHGYSCFGKGYLEEGEKVLQKGIEFCEEASLYSMYPLAHYMLGHISYCSGENLAAINYYSKAVQLLEYSGTLPSVLNFYKVCLARAKMMSNEKDIDLESLYRYAHENNNPAWSGMMQRAIGEILLNSGDKHFSEAEDWLQKAIKTNEENRMMFELALSYYVHAKFFKQKGDQQKARENQGKAIEILKECGADGWVEKYEKELDELLITNRKG